MQHREELEWKLDEIEKNEESEKKLHQYLETRLAEVERREATVRDEFKEECTQRETYEENRRNLEVELLKMKKKLEEELTMKKATIENRPKVDVRKLQKKENELKQEVQKRDKILITASAVAWACTIVSLTGRDWLTDWLAACKRDSSEGGWNGKERGARIA